MSQPILQAVPQVAAQPVQVVIRGEAQPLAHQDPAINAYNLGGFKLIPAVVPQNTNYKNMVGEYIYDYVEKIATETYAPKITGMLIDLPLEEIKQFLYDYGVFYNKVQQAG
jgi:Poly-adenylate binding protein, unique domain